MDQKTKTDPPVTEKVEEDEEVERIIRDTPKNDTEPEKVNATFIRVRVQHTVLVHKHGCAERLHRVFL